MRKIISKINAYLSPQSSIVVTGKPLKPHLSKTHTLVTSRKHLSPQEWELLLKLADPEGDSPPPELLRHKGLSSILSAAQRHGVAEIVSRKFQSLLKREGEITPPVAEAIEALLRDRMQLIAKTILLDHHAEVLSSRFRQYGIRAEIVKGQSFSDALYPDRGDRVYSDVDFLVALEDLPRANSFMRDHGFEIGADRAKEAIHTLEYPWTLQTKTLRILVELQGDLVHSPRLRRHMRFGYAEYMLANQLCAPESIKMLLAATMHTACGNKFNILKVLIDVLQAARRIETSHYPILLKTVQSLRAEFEVGTTLRLVASLFQDEYAHRASELFFHRSSVRVGAWLVSPKTIFESRESSFPIMSGIKRQGFRALQKSRWVRH